MHWHLTPSCQKRDAKNLRLSAGIFSFCNAQLPTEHGAQKFPHSESILSAERTQVVHPWAPRVYVSAGVGCIKRLPASQHPMIFINPACVLDLC